MAKWPAFGRVKTRLSKYVGKQNSLIIQKIMLRHTLTVAQSLEKANFLEISLAVSGIGLRSCERWCKNLGIKNFNLQGSGSLGERMKRQIIVNQTKSSREKRDLIIIGTDLPDLCHRDLLKTISKIKNKDVILGPSNDGGYWLICFSKNLEHSNLLAPLINIRWSNYEVLQKTIENLSLQKLKIDYLNTKVDIDIFSDIEKRG
tara:strand:+ start:539 stop:1147 length:609 start_codon:yes stop_codon:yes gene_type:complete